MRKQISRVFFPPAFEHFAYYVTELLWIQCTCFDLPQEGTTCILLFVISHSLNSRFSEIIWEKKKRKELTDLHDVLKFAAVDVSLCTRLSVCSDFSHVNLQAKQNDRDFRGGRFEKTSDFL